MPPRAPGLSSDQVRSLRQRYGPNLLPPPRRPPAALLLLKQAWHFFAIMLWVAAGLALLAGLPQLAAAIAVVVIVNAVFSFVQEHRADRAAERLRDLLPLNATVRRDGHRTVVPAGELVPGDLVLLEPGDRVSADLRAERVSGLRVDESLLTGESVPRPARAGDTMYAGTHVTDGLAEATVVSTGPATRLGALTRLTRGAHRPRSPLSRQLQRVVTVIAATAVGVGVVFFGLATAVGLAAGEGFLLALGVTVALVPEGLLPTVTLSLARAAQRMAGRNALVKRLESVETLGSTTFICTDKTGTLTRNQMSAMVVWAPAGTAAVTGDGYAPEGVVHADGAVGAAVAELARSAVTAATGRAVWRDGAWRPLGDPTEVALHVLACRAGVAVPPVEHGHPGLRRYPFDAQRRRASALVDGVLHVNGAPDSVLPRCAADPAVVRAATQAVHEYGARGLRVLAVARRTAAPPPESDPDLVERDLELLGLVGLVDPPRPDVADAIGSCRRAGIKLAILTGDHPSTARAIASEVGLLGPDRIVVEGRDLPADDGELATLLDADGVVVARVSPEDKLRIAKVLQQRGHVVAMTGDGVNDAPAMREADIGVAMGASGTDVAREAADLVLLDDHFATIVAAVELGRATYANIRRSLTYHLTDNAAELAPFLVWALTAGTYPLALSVLQILALDIGTDILPALALGAEPPNPRTMQGPPPRRRLIDRKVLGRAFGVLGPPEILVAMTGFTVVLATGGWTWGTQPGPTLLAAASGTAFTAIVLGQLANAFACRSEAVPAWRVRLLGNRLLVGAVVVEGLLLLAFLSPPLAGLLGGDWPPTEGWLFATAAIPAVLIADAVHKALRGRAAARNRRADAAAPTRRDEQVSGLPATPPRRQS
jgi:calcium-translocating P-type ATPase